MKLARCIAGTGGLRFGPNGLSGEAARGNPTTTAVILRVDESKSSLTNRRLDGIFKQHQSSL
ncbi:hypothetical protein E6H34_03175 [Candidatus Bathyarchaeota archaeon]|nr:MAG: hypothetical protein E6H34_03175 [Candidatus Bathyarchaeota archaeon]